MRRYCRCSRCGGWRGLGCDSGCRSLSGKDLRGRRLRAGHLHERYRDEERAQRRERFLAISQIHAHCVGCSRLSISSHCVFPGLRFVVGALKVCRGSKGSEQRRHLISGFRWAEAPTRARLAIKSTPTSRASLLGRSFVRRAFSKLKAQNIPI